MDVDLLDRSLSIVDIILCLADMGMLVYLIKVGRMGRPRPKPYPKFKAYRKERKYRRNRR